ncbi:MULTISPECIES: ADP-heptose--LPS heptosyltransferase [unclassified Caballeronia]|uniref:glycosyltransferase family 9 protein n=1 Tax=unclassified Caballeronia TaxID=2646786 RepID=UPI0028644515|nr:MULTISPECIES: ADP-heptose--LPS heptosyltransferase [unclassified Caballeronia]MDR5751435.1 ADP-heptose--LPS heptosyltransferase [Caballeronia sp. LZ024]MDR5844424.1 ADP-heptose--LPS heptosyltransferase [Caballeronia sp. LZ031]
MPVDPGKNSPDGALDELAALSHPGSLLSPTGEIVAPYDLEVTGAPATGFRPLSSAPGILHANTAAFAADYAAHRKVHAINGMGVTLGDSIIGLTALFAIRKRYPSIDITLYRPARAPRYVQRLYELAAPMIGSVRDLPVTLDALARDDLKIDIGNHLFWPAFAAWPMIDFFLWALGMSAADIPAAEKRNAWLADLPLPRRPQTHDDYVLFCPSASTPVRSIPAPMHARLVERLWQRFALPVKGFGPLDHPHYTDVAPLAPDTADFLAWVKHARYLMTSDTASLHIAAGFDVPATAFFTTIAADLRARDYARCHALKVALPGLQGIHASARTADLAALERAYERLLADETRLFREDDRL